MSTPALDLSALPQKPLLRVDEVAKFLNYSDDTIRMMVCSGELDAHRRDGNRTVMTITRASVVRFLASSATYDEEGVIDALTGIINKMSAGSREKVLKNINRGVGGMHRR